MSPAEFDLFMGGEDEEDQDWPTPPPTTPRGHRILHITQLPDGTAGLREHVLDPGPPARWTTARQRQFPSLQAALGHTGRSRIESDGRVVQVFLDGVRLD